MKKYEIVLMKSLRILRVVRAHHSLNSAFTLVEMLMALLIVSVILSASLPIISQRQKAMASNYNQNRNFPIGGVILWTDMSKLPDNTWMECNGTAIPNGVEYEQARRIFGANTPDLRNTFAYSTNLNNYLKTDLKNYLQTNFSSVLPKNLIAIWGTNDAIPQGWSEAAEYRGVFLRGYGSITHTQNNGSKVGNTSTTHTSGAIGAVQGDAARNITAKLHAGWSTLMTDNLAFYNDPNVRGMNAINGTTNEWSGTAYMNFSRVIPTSNEIRPVNKAVRYIKYTNSSSIPDLPEPPCATKSYRFIAKVRY